MSVEIVCGSDAKIGGPLLSGAGRLVVSLIGEGIEVNDSLARFDSISFSGWSALASYGIRRVVVPRRRLRCRRIVPHQ